MNISSINEQGIDIKKIKMYSDDVYSTNPNKECGILLQIGQVEVYLKDEEVKVRRKSVFDDLPYFIHISPGDVCTIKAKENSEIVVVMMDNKLKFSSKIYKPSDLEKKVLSNNNLENKEKRCIIDIVNYEVEPNAKIVIGEVISDQGSWSSYPPHKHPQPEIYLYKFDKENGFGLSLVDDVASVVREDDFTVIPGGTYHPQATAPGYKMYYLWIIRNFDENPWTERIYDPRHVSLLEEK